MFRFLIILALIFYILSKLGGFFFRVGAASQRNKNFQQRKPDGNIHVDSARKKEKRGNIKGGDYVDYEEVK
jgi:Na+-transporting methylmalonyl-CoA/oxaloacetate decarboxylase gamma subunit